MLVMFVYLHIISKLVSEYLSVTFVSIKNTTCTHYIVCIGYQPPSKTPPPPPLSFQAPPLNQQTLQVTFKSN